MGGKGFTRCGHTVVDFERRKYYESTDDMNIMELGARRPVLYTVWEGIPLGMYRFESVIRSSVGTRRFVLGYMKGVRALTLGVSCLVPPAVDSFVC